MKDRDIAVIIPFYQRERGLLSQAVASVLVQEGPHSADVIVVDDGSPVRAIEEVSCLSAADANSVRVIERRNGGVALARNVGLDAVKPGTRYVAFLDSDDMWTPDHLTKMFCAFDQGADFYFTDYQRPDEAESSFEQNSRGRLLRDEPLGEAADLYWLAGDLFDLVLRFSPVGLSTVGYRFDKVRDARFPTRYRRACEDRMLFASLARRLDRVAYSTTCDVTYGFGVNICKGAAYGSLAGGERIRDSARFHIEMAQRFCLTPEQAEWNRSALASLDDQFVETALICLVKEGVHDFRTIGSYFAMRPAAVSRVPKVLLAALARKFATRKVEGGSASSMDCER